MKIDEVNILHEKAKDRKDGIYSYRGNLWVVKNNRFVAYADYSGKCFQIMGMFTVCIGETDRYKRKELLTKWLFSKT